MPVPHNPPVNRNEGPCNFVAGWNIPGYLPSMEPEFFAEFDDAKRFLLNAMELEADEMAQCGCEDSHCESCHPDDDLDALIQDCNLESKPFTVVANNVAYFVESV